MDTIVREIIPPFNTALYLIWAVLAAYCWRLTQTARPEIFQDSPLYKERILIKGLLMLSLFLIFSTGIAPAWESSNLWFNGVVLLCGFAGGGFLGYMRFAPLTPQELDGG